MSRSQIMVIAVAREHWNSLHIASILAIVSQPFFFHRIVVISVGLVWFSILLCLSWLNRRLGIVGY
jgi:hypothetical protein